jgi:hypothetical protein
MKNTGLDSWGIFYFKCIIKYHCPPKNAAAMVIL